MFLSTKSQYGTRAVVELALRYNGKPVLVKEISRAQKISNKYLESIFTKLKNVGLLQSYRGVNGGYVLAKSPDKIRIIDIVEAVEGPIVAVDCVNNPKACKKTSDCVTREVWKEVNDAVREVLSSISIEDLVIKHKNRHKSSMYYI